MKPGIGLLISLLVSILVLAAGGLIWYLSSTAEFTRKNNPAPPATTPPAKVSPPPKAKPPATPKPVLPPV